VVDLRTGTIGRNLKEYQEDHFDYRRSHYPNNFKQVETSDFNKSSFEEEKIQ
jgi:hypothetical protein